MHLFLLSAALMACKDSAETPALERLTDNAAPDFSLEDMNTASASFAQFISPRDELERISVWYFGHST